ncbi:MAG: hypothetical protein GC191_05530 [Azospirillum sp.]|nr:hypothetical protein [Azospirillum sp.]
MITSDQLPTVVQGVRVEQVEDWVVRRWVVPQPQDGGPDRGWLFAEIDVARIRLIRDLHDDLHLGDEAIPVVLSLLDQIHGLRHELRCLAAAVEVQPREIRERILDALAGTAG